MYFIKQNMTNFKIMFAQLTQPEIMRKLSNTWHSLTDMQKKPFY